MKKYTDYKKIRKDVETKYPNVKFSSDFYETYEKTDWDIDGMKYVFLEKLNNFDEFQSKYNIIGIRINNGIDLYKEAIIIYDKIVNGELYADKELHNPDNKLKNAIQLMYIDKYKAINNK